MSIRDLKDLSKDDLLGALGLQTKQSAMEAMLP